MWRSDGRDDEHDKSDEDEEEGRVDFSINSAARERQRIRDDFMAAEHGEFSCRLRDERENDLVRVACSSLPCVRDLWYISASV